MDVKCRILFVVVALLLVSCSSPDSGSKRSLKLDKQEAKMVIKVTPSWATITVSGAAKDEDAAGTALTPEGFTARLETFVVTAGDVSFKVSAEGFPDAHWSGKVREGQQHDFMVELERSEKGSVVQYVNVDAGGDRATTQGQALRLSSNVDAQGTSDLPKMKWVKQSGPGSVEFSDAENYETLATFDKDGTYLLRFSASADKLASSDDILVTVAPGNGEPVEDDTLPRPTEPAPVPAPSDEPPTDDGPSEDEGGANEPVTPEANALYIATNGNDGNVGSLDKPFKTIQKCASVAKSGETCIVRAGIYRESVKPANSGISFKAQEGEKVTISGADAITGWSVHSGDIYKAPMNFDLGAGSNQVLVDGKMMTEARWPNVTTRLDRGKFATPDNAYQSGGSWTLADGDLKNVPSSGYVNLSLGGLGLSWITQTARITSASNGKVSFKPVREGFHYYPHKGTPYYIWGDLSLLDSKEEWFYKDGTLYLWNEGGAPKNVEAKRRTVAFDFNGLSNIAVKDINVRAATIVTDGNSANIVFDNLLIEYVSHFTYVDTNPWTFGSNSGVLLQGRNHTFKNSVVRYSAGNGVSMHGTGHILTNNVIHDVSYGGTEGAAVSMSCGVCSGSSSSHQVTWNTLYNSGRSVLVHRKVGKSKILHNHMYNAGILMDDLGVTYSYETDGQGTEIAYNYIHDNKASHVGLGIYLDHNSNNHFIHHNAIWNTDDALRFNFPSRNNKAYNNILYARKQSVDYWGTNRNAKDLSGTEVFNNVTNKDIRLNYGANQGNNHKGDPGFNNFDARDFTLRAGSPVIDKGRVFSPYTDGYTGSAPDLGAFEYGGKIWKAGASFETP